MNSNSRWSLILYGGIVLADLFLMHAGHPARLISKGLLMPTLFLFFFCSKPENDIFSRLIYAGLFFSWLGDIFLHLDKINSLFFLIGLSFFLTTHICYIRFFLRIRSGKTSYLKERPVMLLAILAYVLELLYLLWPGLGTLKLPVALYALVIGTMFATAAWQYEKIPVRPALFFIGGSLLFVLSDSLLAIGKFLRPLPLNGFLVMCTYVLAQLFIVAGAIAFRKEHHSVEAVWEDLA